MKKTYFLGFIFADGSVTNDTKTYRNRVTLKLHTKDVHILESFIKSVNGEMSVWKHGQREMVEVGMSSKKMVNDLANLGVTPNKTFTLQYPTINETLEKHFLRGYFDGDGCIRVSEDKRDKSKRGDLRIVSGSLDILNKINERMNVLFGTNINKLYGPKDKDFKYIGWAGMTDIEKIYHGFYDNSVLFLNRKKIIFDEVIGIINSKNKYRKK
jgi:intein-encoded DNA endonuclease-like protein